MRKLIRKFKEATSDNNFRHFIESIEVVVAKLLALLMLIVIFAAIVDLAIFISQQLFPPNQDNFRRNLFKVFGLFLNVLIALELLENISGYLKKHVLQVELVIVTALIAIGRKIIILDLKVIEGIELIGLGIAILSLSISYFIIRGSNPR
jgi:uncharacterized membrane protein (DUF373 family)